MPVLDEVWFTLSENMNTENDGSCCYKNVHAFCDIPLLDFKIGVWYTLNACKIIGTILFEETNSSQYTFINSDTFIWGIMRRSVNAGLCL
jgi:hypothetical protein